jgi:GNAT superfamily N-acetyltransferase
MITYRTDAPLSVEQFIDILARSGLAARRPVDDHACIAGMLAQADLTVTAWDAELLVGIARSVTDFHYCCYLSDLAVDQVYQRQGIGTHLITQTRDALGPRCTLILLSAPAAVDYYPRLGFDQHPQAWVLPAHKSLHP